MTISIDIKKEREKKTETLLEQIAQKDNEAH